ESSRYLTNQLLLRELKDSGQYDSAFDNGANGMTDWLLSLLQDFLKSDFDEYNSRPYQGFSVMALENLYDFSEDVRVKEAAHLVLDYLSAKFAISSSGLRRSLPFRRLESFVSRTDMLFV